MNLLQAYQFLNMINEGMEDYQEKYKNYVLEHKERVRQYASWLKENLPEIFEDVDLDSFDEVISEHDESKFSEEEFEPYAKHFYDDDDYSLEFDDAWEHHWMNNEHHPEYWLGQDMPYIYILEMLCDWGSFSVAKGNYTELIDFYYDKARNDEEKNLSDNTKIIIEEILDKIENVASEREPLEEDNNPSLDYIKQKQLEVIFKTNPAHDDIHTWIRDIKDILTFEEVMKLNKYPGEDFDPSYSYAMAEAALTSGKIKVYSSYPIKEGTFVTPSMLEAESYSGSKNIYSKEVDLLDVAWIDPTQGIFTGEI